MLFKAHNIEVQGFHSNFIIFFFCHIYLNKKINKNQNMKLNKLQRIGKYKSESGGVIRFIIDIDHAKEYELDEALSFFISATNDFARCKDHWFNADKAKMLKKPEKETKFKKLLMEDNAKGLEKVKKAKMLIKKPLDNFKNIEKKMKVSHEEFKKNMNKREAELKENLMVANLSLDEIKIILEEFTKSRKIFEIEGRQGLIKHLSNQFEELEELCSDPSKGWKRASVTCVICIIILLILAIGFIVTTIIIISYIVNWNTKEIHDLKNESPACKIDEMTPEGKEYFKTFEEADHYFKNKGFNGCAWCMPQYHTD